MKTRNLPILLSWVATVAIILALVKWYPNQPTTNTEDRSMDGPTVYEYAIGMYTDYKENALRADEKYKNKIVAVTGWTEDIGTDIRGKPYITLSVAAVDKYTTTVVQCFIQPSQVGLASQLHKGVLVQITGKCTGKFMNITLYDCTIEVARK